MRATSYCCPQLPAWNSAGQRTALGGSQTALEEWQSFLTGELAEFEGLGGAAGTEPFIFSRGVASVFCLEGVNKIRKYKANYPDVIWESSAAGVSIEADIWNSICIGDFGLICLQGYGDFGSSNDYLFWIDDDGAWVFEPDSLVSITLDGTEQFGSVGQLRLSPNSMHAAVHNGAAIRIGTFDIETVTGGLRIAVTSISTTTSPGTLDSAPMLGYGADAALYYVHRSSSARKIIIPGAGINTTASTADAILYAAPGGLMSWIYTNSAGTDHHGIVNLDGSVHDYTGDLPGTADQWLLIPIASRWACSKVATPTEIEDAFPALTNVGELPTESGNIDLKKYWFNKSLTLLERREPWNVSSPAFIPLGIHYQVLVQDSIHFIGSPFRWSSDLADKTGGVLFPAPPAGPHNWGWIYLLPDPADTSVELLIQFDSAPTNFDLADIIVYCRGLETLGFYYEDFTYNIPIENDVLDAQHSITFDDPESADLVADSATQWTLTVNNIVGNGRGGILTVAMRGARDIYSSSQLVPLRPNPESIFAYYIPRSTFEVDFLRRGDVALSGTTAIFDIRFKANAVDVDLIDFDVAVTGTVTYGDMTLIVGSGDRTFTIEIDDVAGGVSGGTIGLNLDAGHDITSTEAPFTLAVDVDETYSVAAE